MEKEFNFSRKKIPPFLREVGKNKHKTKVQFKQVWQRFWGCWVQIRIPFFTYTSSFEIHQPNFQKRRIIKFQIEFFFKAKMCWLCFYPLVQLFMGMGYAVWSSSSAYLLNQREIFRDDEGWKMTYTAMTGYFDECSQWQIVIDGRFTEQNEWVCPSETQLPGYGRSGREPAIISSQNVWKH